MTSPTDRFDGIEFDNDFEVKPDLLADLQRRVEEARYRIFNALSSLDSARAGKEPTR